MIGLALSTCPLITRPKKASHKFFRIVIVTQGIYQYLGRTKRTCVNCDLKNILLFYAPMALFVNYLKNRHFPDPPSPSYLNRSKNVCKKCILKDSSWTGTTVYAASER